MNTQATAEHAGPSSDPIVRALRAERKRVEGDRGAAEALLETLGLLRRNEQGRLVETYLHAGSDVASP